MGDVGDATNQECRALCDAAWAVIAAKLDVSVDQERLARLIVAGAEVRDLPARLGIKLSAIRKKLRRLYAKAGWPYKREHFTARVYDIYRNWRRDQSPCIGGRTYP